MITDMADGISMTTVWLVLTAILAILEIFTLAVAALCLCIGTLAALMASMAGLSVVAQVVVFVIALLLSLIAIPPLVRRLRSGARSCDCHSNMDALTGRRAVVENRSGSLRVRIDGDSWQIRAAGNFDIAEGECVEVVGFDSIVLLVKPATADKSDK